MIETAISLFCAHLLADFVLQTRKMVASKGNPLVLLAHVGIVVVAAWILTGSSDYVALAILGGTHLAFDWIKHRSDTGTSANAGTDAGRQGVARRALGVFIFDQIGHCLVIGALAVFYRDMFSQGWWGTDGSGIYQFLPELDKHAYLTALVFLAGLIGAVRTGCFLIERFVATLGHRPEDEHGLSGAGMMIGQLERSLIFFLVLAGEPAAIGFLVAAKSVLRFETAKNPKNRHTSEYIIIGTLASFGWAIIVSYLTLFAFDLV